MWMLGSQGLFLDRQRALVERLGLPVTALGLVEQRQVVEARGHMWMLGSRDSHQAGASGCGDANWMGWLPADHPFGHGEVDGPAGAHKQRFAKLARRADDQEPGQKDRRTV